MAAAERQLRFVKFYELIQVSQNQQEETLRTFINSATDPVKSEQRKFQERRGEQSDLRHETSVDLAVARNRMNESNAGLLPVGFSFPVR